MIHSNKEDFWKYVENFLVKYDKEYTIIKKGSSGSYVEAIYDKEKKLGRFYKNRLSDDELKKLTWFSQIKRQVNNWLAKNRLTIISGRYPSIKKGVAWHDIPEGGKFMGTDLNHCYWRIAYCLGYVNYRLYKRLLGKKYKLTRNKALACLPSKRYVYEFKGATLLRSYPEGDGQLKQLYDDIRFRAYKMMFDIAEVIGTGFIKYNVDCIYYLPEHQHTVEKMLKEFDMKFTTFECEKMDSTCFMELKDEFKIKDYS